ncbi:hypothetical protein GCM10017655_45030 [Pseudomonas turukhanskensis]|uniref:Uncharacterized protein n=1 Tax=Pseudomonas turukhanskensis TaxID=1806536 RepID=A0A9W6KB95_9PSED|nr:hypothetical protein GCM10017655_45030 [Pseudomonas turukhanskensis]
MTAPRAAVLPLTAFEQLNYSQTVAEDLGVKPGLNGVFQRTTPLLSELFALLEHVAPLQA